MQHSAARIVKPKAVKRRRCEEIAPGQLLVLNNVSWESYEQIGEALRDRPAIRLTYDQGTLEIMTTSHLHERRKSLLGMLILILAEEAGVPLVSSGQMTCKKEDLEKGV